MAMWGESTATQPAVLGLLGGGKQEGSTGHRARPSTGAAGAPGRTRLRGRYARAGEWQCMALRAGMPCVPRWLGVAPSCSTTGKSLAAIPCSMENFLLPQDAAQPRCAFPIMDVSCGTGGPGWKWGYRGSWLL